jgi:hypothetical protein
MPLAEAVAAVGASVEGPLALMMSTSSIGDVIACASGSETPRAMEKRANSNKIDNSLVTVKAQSTNQNHTHLNTPINCFIHCKHAGSVHLALPSRLEFFPIAFWPCMHVHAFMHSRTTGGIRARRNTPACSPHRRHGLLTTRILPF